MLFDEAPSRLVETTRDGAIREMLVALVESGKLGRANIEHAFRVLLDREEIGSTGIGDGVAIPRGKSTFFQPERHSVLEYLRRESTGVRWMINQSDW